MLAIEPGDHIGSTFTSPAEFAAATVAFSEQAIRAAAQVVVFPGDPHRQELTGFREHLREQSPALARACARGQLQVADSRQVQLAPGRFDPAHLRQAYTAATAQALSAGYRGLWVSVDMTWAADVAPGVLTAFEADAFALFTSRDLTALCQYDERVFPAAVAADACAAHPAGLDSPQPLRHRRGPDGPLALSGEVDRTNQAAFNALLRSLRAGDTLDLTAMSFIDVRGLVAVADRQSRLPGLTVRASNFHSDLLRLIRAGATHQVAAR